MINLTQHLSTEEQRAQGLVEPAAEDRAEIQSLLTFDASPIGEDVIDRAMSLAVIAARLTRADTDGGGRHDLL